MRLSVASASMVALMITLSWCASVFAQSTPYNTSDTFQPGRKYNCVPTADRKGWECNEIGKADKAPREAPAETPPSAPPAQETKPAPTPAAPAPTQTPATSQPSSGDRSSSLPSYLTNASANSAAPPPPPSTISATANHANEPPIQSVPSPRPVKPPVAAKPAPAVPSKATPAVVAKPSVKQGHPAPRTPPKPAAPAREISHPAIPANGDFIALAGDRFVIELAHAPRQADLAASRGATKIPRGDLYEVHLRQNGADAWLLLWGTFDTIEAARSARGELAQGTTATVGWPRRVAPLQAEARRVSE
jgi:hypothetical protein